MKTVITARMCHELREKTDISIMECKHALELTNGDMLAAEENLRHPKTLERRVQLIELALVKLKERFNIDLF